MAKGSDLDPQMFDRPFDRRQFLKYAGVTTAGGLLVSGGMTARAARAATSGQLGALATPTAKPINLLRVAIEGSLTKQDPATITARPDFITCFLTTSRLYHSDNNFDPIPDLANGMPVFSDQGLTATVKLKKGLKFSDGSPLTAADVAATLGRAKKSTRAYLLAPIASVRATNPTTVVFRLSYPWLDLALQLSDLSMSIHPLKRAADPQYFFNPVSSGPYVLQPWKPGDQSWTLKANPNWFRGQPMAKTVTYGVVADPTQRILQLSSGAVDYVFDVPTQFQASHPAAVTVRKVFSGGVFHLAINNGLPASHPLRNANVRHAMSLAIDRQAISKAAFSGFSTPSKGFHFTEMGKQGLAVLPKNGQRDLVAAKARLAKTPFASGFKFTLKTSTSRPGFVNAALIIAQNLSDIGGNIEVIQAVDAVSLADLFSGNYETLFQGGVGDPLGFLKNQFLNQAQWAGWLKYSNPNVVDALNAATSATTFDLRVALMHKAQQLAFTDLPLIPIGDRFTMVGDRFGGKVMSEAVLEPGVNPQVKAAV